MLDGAQSYPDSNNQLTFPRNIVPYYGTQKLAEKLPTNNIRNWTLTDAKNGIEREDQAYKESI